MIRGPSPTAGRGAWAPVAVLLLSSSLTVMAGAVLTPVVATLGEDLGLSGTEAGLVLTTHALSLALASPLMGALLDRHGPRPVLVAGLIGYAVAGGAGALLDSYAALLGSRLLFGVGAAAVFSATTVALLDAGRGSAQDRLMGWRGTAMSAGGVVWPLVGGAAGAATWHGSFAIYLLGLPLGVAAWLLLPRGPSDLRGAGPGAAGSPRGLGAVLRDDPTILGLCVLFAIGAVMLYTLLVFVPMRLTELGSGTTTTVAVFASVMSLAMSVSGLAFARLSNRLAPAVLLCLAYAATAVAFAVVAAGQHVAALLVGLVLFGAASGVTLPALTVLLGRRAPAGLLGRVTALSGTAIFLGQFLSPLLVGPIADATSTSAAFAVTAAVSALVAGVLAPAAVRRQGGRGRRRSRAAT